MDAPPRLLVALLPELQLAADAALGADLPPGHGGVAAGVGGAEVLGLEAFAAAPSHEEGVVAGAKYPVWSERGSRFRTSEEKKSLQKLVLLNVQTIAGI